MERQQVYEQLGQRCGSGTRLRLVLAGRSVACRAKTNSLKRFLDFSRTALAAGLVSETRASFNMLLILSGMALATAFANQPFPDETGPCAPEYHAIRANAKVIRMAQAVRLAWLPDI